MKYFVMINHPNNNRPIPLTEDDDDFPYIFNNKEEANITAKNNPLASANGYEIYDWNF